MSGSNRIVRPYLGASTPIRAISYHFSGNAATSSGCFVASPSASMPQSGNGCQTSGAAGCATRPGLLGLLQSAAGSIVAQHVKMGNAFTDLATTVARSLTTAIAGTPPDTPPTKGQQTPAPPTVSQCAPASQPGTIVCCVRSQRRTEARLDLHPPTGKRFIPNVHALYSQDRSGPAIEYIRFASAGARSDTVLTIDVPDDQPPGVYTGVVVDDATGEPGGTLILQVF
jgi:hypothetical protein